MNRVIRPAVMAVLMLVAGAGVASARHGGHRPWGYWAGWSGWWWGAPAVAVYVRPPADGPRLTAVDLDVSPEETRVLLGGKLIGVADDFDGYPDYLYLEPGEYTLEFQLPGYKTETMKISAEPGRFVPVDMKLASVPGEKPPAWWDRPKDLPASRVFGSLNKPKLEGEDDEDDKDDESGGEDDAVWGDVNPAEGQTQPQRGKGADPTLRPETHEVVSSAAPVVKAGASLDFKIVPPHAAVYVDGVMVGSGEELARLERGLSVSAGRHKVEAIAPGMAQQTVEVEVASGDRQSVVINLGSGGLDKPD